MSLLDRVRALLGSDALLESAGPDGVPRVAPDSPDAVALLLGTAGEEGWRVRIEGAGPWMPSDAPCYLAPTTRRLDRVPAIEPQDLSATAEAGIGFDLLRHQLADRGVWLAIDPPGLGGRSVGSVVATATTGPLRQGFGPVRDHLLGVTFVTGDGRIVQSGGRVVKNVAGYDLTKLEAGGVGAFGVIVVVPLRLPAPPRADPTFVLEGSPEGLTQVAEDVAAGGLQPAGPELICPAPASPGVGAIRWAGDATVDRLRRLRRTLAGLEVPLTLERAPWAIRSAVGHFGAYREGVGPLVAGLRRTFDPGEAFVVAVEGSD